MQTINQYALVRDNDPERLINEVNILIRQGWQPHGSLVATHEGNSFYYTQPMVKAYPSPLFEAVLESVTVASTEPASTKPTRRAGGAK